jgi:Tfp pilus assembly protein PilF
MKVSSMLAVALVLALGGAGCGRAGAAPPATAGDSRGGDDEAAAGRELLELGLAFARAGDSVRGEQYLSAALEAGTDPNQALLPLMQLCIKAGRFEAAAQYGEAYQRDVQAKRELAMLLSGLYIALDQDEKAIKQLEQVASDYPELALAHLLLGRLLRQKERDLEQADVHFRGYLRLEPDGVYAREARASLLKRLRDAQPLPRVGPDQAPGPALEPN